MTDFFSNLNLNNWWKRKLAMLGVNNRNTQFGLKIGTCAICGREDYVFPSGELHVGDDCYQHMLDNGAKITFHNVAISLKPIKCDVCGRKIYKYHIVQTYICNKCTRQIGKKAKENRAYYGARKIA